MRYILASLLCLISLALGEDTSYLIDPIEDVDLFAGEHMMQELENMEALLSVTSGEVLGLASGDSRKHPGAENGYYTINGNKDIVIQGYNKQSLYKNATDSWNAQASYTLPVSNVGYLTYGNITLCDITELENGVNYSEFIYGVQINGFSTNYEYRLELNNGQVTLWSKLPGTSGDGGIDIPGTMTPEPKLAMYCLIAVIVGIADRKRK